MFIITVFNTIVRISAIGESDFLISREPFQLMFVKLNVFIMYIPHEKDYSPMCASDILHSIFQNLVKNDFAEICFKRLLFNETKSITVVSTLIDAGYIKKGIEWIRTDIFASHMSALANEENNEYLTGAFGRTLISLATSNEQSEENKKLILDTCETLYKWCMEAEQYLDLVFEGIHLSEVLELLHHAFTNTYIIKYILGNKNNEKPTPIQYFAQLFLSIYGVLLDPEPDELEKRAVKYLLKILLQMSSYSEYLKELIDNSQICIIIESLANHPKRDDAKRIWCNIQQMISPNESKKEMSSMIYISYDYADEEFCKELRKKITIPIWIDYENVELYDDMWEYVYPIITSATTVVTLISTAYSESMDKFQELSYIISANKLKDAKKALIVVTIEHNFNFKQSRM
ncbi:unnamed protein product, partial [Adineta steineri]